MMLVRNALSICSSVTSPTSGVLSWCAALFTSTSSRPKALTVRSTASVQNAGTRHVPGDQLAAATLGLHRDAGLLGVGLLGRQVDDGHVGPLAGEEDCHRPADAGVPAGDQRRQPGELARPLVERGQVERFRVHVGLQPRLGLRLRLEGAGGFLRLRGRGHRASPGGGSGGVAGARVVPVPEPRSRVRTSWPSGRTRSRRIDQKSGTAIATAATPDLPAAADPP